MFTLRDYEKRDFDVLFQLDRLCFDPGIAYSRPELASFIERRRSFTIVAEWNAEPDAAELNGAEPDVPDADAAQPVPVPAEATGEFATHTRSAGHTQASSAHAGASQSSATHPSAIPPSHGRRRIAGFVTCHFQPQGYGHIITIDVHPDARRHHVGTLLVDATCARLRKMTAFMVVLEVAVNNHAALAFYDRYGFKRVKVLERYYSRDLDAVFMTKRL